MAAGGEPAMTGVQATAAGGEPAASGAEPVPVAEPAVEPPGSAEITTPLPPVQDQQPPESTINQPTTVLPLLDRLAPPQRAGTPPGGVPSPPPPGSGYGDLFSTELLSGRTHAAPGYPDPGYAARPGDPAVTMVGPVGPIVTPPAPRRSGQRGWPLVAMIIGAVVLLGLIGWLAIDSLPGGAPAASTTQGPAPTSAVIAAGGYQFTQHAAKADTDCASNAYGQVADFFRDTPCMGLRRLLFTSSAGGEPVVVSVSTVTMSDERSAAALKKLADTNGTGNVSDLLRAGVRPSSVPSSLTGASYASDHEDEVVVIVEADYTDPSKRSDEELDKITEAAIELGQGG